MANLIGIPPNEVINCFYEADLVIYSVNYAGDIHDDILRQHAVLVPEYSFDERDNTDHLVPRTLKIQNHTKPCFSGLTARQGAYTINQLNHLSSFINGYNTYILSHNYKLDMETNMIQIEESPNSGIGNILMDIYYDLDRNLSLSMWFEMWDGNIFLRLME